MTAKTIRPLERPPALFESVRESIKAYILDNRLQAGDPLPAETELAAQLGVSRNSVREAVKALESLGILETRRGSGLFVRKFSLDPLLDNLPYALLSNLQDLDDLFDIRRILEVALVGEALANLTEEQSTRLQQIVERMRVRAEQGEAFVQEDREFHQCLFENVGNKMLLTLLDIFWLTFRKASQKTDIQDIKPMNTYRSHAAIVAAVIARDEAEARAALDRHYDDLNGRLQRVRQERGWER